MENTDHELWRIAKKRASFKRHLVSYIIVNGFLWALWWITSRGENESLFEAWPIWSTLGWGVGMAFDYYGAYHDNRKDDILKEYQKLKDKEGKQ